jgi:hypothetical protein
VHSEVGCRAWKYVAKPHQRAVKLAPCSLACIFVGCSADHMAYRLWDPSTRKVELARNVQFFENVFPAAGDRSDAQELVFNIVSFPDEGSQQRGDSGNASTPSNPPESVSDNSEHIIQLPVAPEAPAAPSAPHITLEHRQQLQQHLHQSSIASRGSSELILSTSCLQRVLLLSQRLLLLQNASQLLLHLLHLFLQLLSLRLALLRLSMLLQCPGLSPECTQSK